VARAVSVGQAKRLAKAEITAERVLEEMRRVAFVDIRSLFDARGNLKAVSELTAEEGAVLSSIEVVKQNLTAGDSAVDTIHKVRLWDKIRALEILAKHFALLVDRAEHTGAGRPLTIEVVRKMSDEDIEERLAEIAARRLPAKAGT
jgi:phage terminase small subunit